MLGHAPTDIRFAVTLLLAVALTLAGCQLWKRRYGGERKRVNGYDAVFVLLLVWAVADLCHCAGIGRELTDRYSQGIVLQLVQDTLVRGLAKLLLAAAVLLVGRIRRRSTPCTALTAITWLLAAAAAVIWGAGMACLTSVTAEYAAERYLDAHSDRADRIASYSYAGRLDWDDSPYANYRESRFWEAVSSRLFWDGSPAVSGDSWFLARRDGADCVAATAIYDASGSCLANSWTDFISFAYLTEEQWLAGEERSGQYARAILDREKLTETGWELAQDGSLSFDAAALCLTGSFDGVDLTPAEILYIDWESFQTYLRQQGSGTYTVSQVVQDWSIPWRTLYRDDDALSHGGERITLYTGQFDLCITPASPAFTYQGRTYANVAALVEALGPTLADGTQSLSRYEGADLLIPSVSYCHSFGGETYSDPYYYGAEAYAEEAPELHFYTVSAVWCSPWRTAVRELRDVYIGTFLLALALVLAVRCAVRRHLVQPVQAVGSALVSGEELTPLDPALSAAWHESRQLQEGLARCSDRLRMQRNEITRLHTALAYAQKAEEERRQLTSHVAHELKTPLAVLHSYAEGLQEHIAEDKRDRYLEVILAETERMDALVLEMLDLSRLEAGKVKLARDTFSLAELARSVFERLEMAARAKALQVTWEVPGDCVITADQARIEQVVENFAVNAVKYAPAGSEIRVRLSTGPRMTRFSVENDCEPLSQEALAHVWDSFYRGDQARDRGGTGLGLAIARSIIHLHGGTCGARATKNGVEFSFVL